MWSHRLLVLVVREIPFNLCQSSHSTASLQFLEVFIIPIFLHVQFHYLRESRALAKRLNAQRPTAPDLSDVHLFRVNIP